MIRSLEVAFTVDAKLLDELGLRLVTSNHVALAELIKNAYDADATEVSVSFIGTRTADRAALKKARIEVCDDGHGMTFDDVQEKWMRVATKSKVDDQKSPLYNRQRTGSKGIGRFAILRLSKCLELTTTSFISPNSYETTSIQFDWDKLHDGTQLSNLKFPATIEVTKAKRKTGVTLSFTRLNQHWTERDVAVLRRSLAGLISPHEGAPQSGKKADPGFDVTISDDDSSTEIEGTTSTVSEAMYDAGWARLIGGVADGGGSMNLRLKAKGLPQQRLQLPLSKEIRQLGKNLFFDIVWFPGKKETWRDTKVATNKSVEDFLENQSGIRVYLNDHRVFPYGDAHDDWVGMGQWALSRRGHVDEPLRELAKQLGVDPSRTLLDVPKPSRLSGRVVLYQGPTGPLQSKTDRMGFLENAAFDNLRQLVQLSIQWMTIQYSKYKTLHLDNVADEETQKLLTISAEKENVQHVHHSIPSEIDQTEVAVSILDRLVSEQESGRDEIVFQGKSKDVFDQALIALKASSKSSSNHQAILELQASTGPILFTFSHEIKGILGSLTAIASDAEALVGKVPINISNMLDTFSKETRETHLQLSGLVELLGLFSLSARDRNPRPQALLAITEKIKSGMKGLTDPYGIDIQIKIDRSVKTCPMLAAAPATILINLISNSIKAVLAGRSGERKIEVSAERSEKHLRLLVSDTGIGISKKFRESVFEPFNSDPEGKIYLALSKVIKDNELSLSLAQGSGLGLSIVRSIVLREGGTVNFIEPRKKWVTEIEVTLP